MITFGDYLIDSGHHDITPEQEREVEAREECARRGIEPDAECADGGVAAWMIVAQEIALRGDSAAAWDKCEERRIEALRWQGRAELLEALCGENAHILSVIEREIGEWECNGPDEKPTTVSGLIEAERAIYRARVQS